MLPSTQLCLSYKLRSFFSNSYFLQSLHDCNFFRRKTQSGAFPPLTSFDCQRVGVSESLCVEARACACVPQWVCLYAQPTRRVCEGVNFVMLN